MWCGSERIRASAETLAIPWVAVPVLQILVCGVAGNEFLVCPVFAPMIPFRHQFVLPLGGRALLGGRIGGCGVNSVGGHKQQDGEQDFAHADSLCRSALLRRWRGEFCRPAAGIGCGCGEFEASVTQFRHAGLQASWVSFPDCAFIPPGVLA